jgi:branched-chain amino acid transport system permease protein
MRRRVALAAGLAMLAMVLAALPFMTSNYLVRLATIAFMYVTLASSWNLIGGLTGYPSFATAAFFGIGAYGSGIVRAYAPLPAAWLAGAVAAGLFAVLIGPAILWLRGHYFAVASLVLAAVLREIVNGATGGLGSFRHAIARLRAVIPPKPGTRPGDATPARVLPS